jgi:hypothetical protein
VTAVCQCAEPQPMWLAAGLGLEDAAVLCCWLSVLVLNAEAPPSSNGLLAPLAVCLLPLAVAAVGEPCVP